MSNKIKTPVLISSFIVILILILFGIVKLSSSLDINNTYRETNNKYVEIYVENLEIPWEIEFLSENDLLVTQRSGSLVRIKNENKTTIPINNVLESGEGGLLGLTLHPNFKNNSQIYLYLTTSSGEGTSNRVERYVFNSKDNTLSEKKLIIDNIPGAKYHDGGRIDFGPDNLLYITTGDATIPELSQDLTSLAGKTLRLDDEGNIPKENPFGTEIYSYGHRNSQGLAWDNQGNLWSTEHGRSGIRSGFDELNLIESGKNYGWPTIEGDETNNDMISPVVHSSSKITWAPASALYYNGNILFTGLRGKSIYRYNIETKEIKTYFENDFGRLRDIEYYNGSIYVSTSNTDGRGNPSINDDVILKIDSRIFD